MKEDFEELEILKIYCKYLEDLILDFRNKIVLNGGLTDFSILKKYDKHFKIEKYV